MVARAIIAAAGVYGDDPVRALTAKRGPLRRCLAPALEGVAQEAGGSARALHRRLGLGGNNVARARREGGSVYARAVRAAARAASYAAWRPEARESLVGGAGNDAIEPPPTPAPAAVAPKTRKAPRISQRETFATPAVVDVAPALVRAPGQGLTEEDEVHLASIARANGGKGFPVLVKVR